ncbi:uncharacterized protein [Panulirus ornatus]|uniref:uncharacterized protein n=1 Tax=Panulirus ornatus TaxID=150431 RepID=UPI003A853B17
MKKSLILLLLGSWQLWLTSALPADDKASQSTAPVPTPPHGEKLDALSSVLPLVRFECQGRPVGYHGDMDFGCSVFHYCGDAGQRFTYKCTEGLKFNEMTTTCSAGFFGDCTHPEIIGSAGRDESAKPAPVQSFQKVPVFVKDETDDQDDPGDYPEPYIQHYDPALDLDYNYQYYDTDDIESATPDEESTAPNRMMKSRHFKRASSGLWDKSMSSALSAFASLANIPYDNPSSNQARIDRSDNVGRVQYIDTIDRAFIARPPQRRRPPQRQSSSHFFQLPFFHGSSKQPGRVPPTLYTPGPGQKAIRVQQQHLHLRPPTNTFSLQEDPSHGGAPHYRQPLDPRDPDSTYDVHSNSHATTEASQTTPDPFRPSSLFSADLDDFQPVTQASKPASPRESTDLVRPNREASPQTGHSAVSTTFQSFSPSSSVFGSAARLSGQNFIHPQTTPRTAQTTPQSFLPTPRFPSSGNFVFNQPPIHPVIFNQPFHHSRTSTGTTFGGSSHAESFGHPSVGRQPVQNSDRQPAPQFVQGFHRQPVQTFVHQPAPQPLPSFSQVTAPPQTVQGFRRPASTPQHVQNFVNPSIPSAQQHPGKPPAGLSFTHPAPQKRPVESFVRPTGPPSFISHTPSPVGSQGHFSPEFQHERPTPQGHSVPQQTFHHNLHRPTEAPSSAATIRPQTERPFVTEESLRTQQDFSFGFQKTSAVPRVVSERPGVFDGFHFNGNTLTQSQGQHTEERPKDTNTGQPTSDQHSTRRRPVSHQKKPALDDQNTRRRPVGHQEDPALDHQNTRGRPVSHQEKPALDHQNTRGRPVSHQDQPASGHQNTRGRPISHQEAPASDHQNTRGRPISHQEAPALDHQNTRRRPISHQGEPALDHQSTRGRPVGHQEEPALDHQSTRGRPISHQEEPALDHQSIRGRPVSHQEEPALDHQSTRGRPVGHQEEDHLIRRRPTRPRRPPTTQQPATTPTLITGLENSEFNNHFLQPHGRRPSITRLHPLPAPDDVPEGSFVHTTPRTTQVTPGLPRLPEVPNLLGAGIFQPPAVTSDPYLPNEDFAQNHQINDDPRTQVDIPTHTFKEDLPNDIIHPDEGTKDDTNAILSFEGDDRNVADVTEVVTEPIITTTTTTRRPFVRRRPIIRNRLRPRLSSRTTTAAPTQIEPKVPSEGEVTVAETTDPAVTEATPATTTTLSPLRQRIEERLNRLKNRRHKSRQSTTEQPKSNTDTTTTSSSTSRRRLPSRRGSLSRQRFQSIRSRLRSRTSTTESPASHSEGTTTETPLHTGSSRTSTRNRRINEYKPKSDEPREEYVLEVKEILRRDQDAQETTRSVVHEKPDIDEQSPVETLTAQTRNVESDPKEEEVPSDQSSLQDPEGKNHDTGEEGQANASRSPESNDQDTSVTRVNEGESKVINPDFRARFREYLKNRKNRVSASYRTTESPVTSDNLKEADDNSQKEPNEHDETSGPIAKERMQLFQQRRRELRAKFLSRQTNDRERVSRRIPSRPFGNKFSSQTKPEESRTTSPKETPEESQDSVKEEAKSREISFQPQQPNINAQDDDSLKTQETTSTISREYRPTLASLISNLPSSVPIDQRPKEPEIITAPSNIQGEAMSMSFKVSTSLATNLKDGTTRIGNDFKDHEPETHEPMEITVEEIGIDSREHEEENPDLKGTQPEITEHSFPPFQSQPTFDSPADEPPQSSPHPPILISVLPSVLKASSTAVPSVSIPSQTTASVESHTTTGSDDLSESHENTESRDVPAFNEKKDLSDLLMSHENSRMLQTFPEPQDIRESADLVKSSGRRVSKPSFNLGAILGRSRPKNTASSAASASDSSGSLGKEATPEPLLSITMATDPPRLPLEVLLPLYETR